MTLWGLIASQAFAAVSSRLASNMMPDAYEEGGAVVGLIISAGFLLALILSKLE